MITNNIARPASQSLNMLKIQNMVDERIGLVCQQSKSVLRNTIMEGKPFSAESNIRRMMKPLELQERQNDCGPANECKPEYYKICTDFEKYHCRVCVSGWTKLTSDDTVAAEASRIGQSFRMAGERQFDRTVVEAILGDVQLKDEYDNPAGSVGIPESQIVDVDGLGLTTDKLLTLSGCLMSNCPEDEGHIYVGMTQADMANMIINNPDMASIDTSDVKAKVTGKIFHYGGVHFVILPELTKDCVSGVGNRIPTFPIYYDVTTNTYYRELPVWSKGSIESNERDPFRVTVVPDHETLMQSVNVHATYVYGANPLDNCGRGMIRVLVTPEEAAKYDQTEIINL